MIPQCHSSVVSLQGRWAQRPIPKLRLRARLTMPSEIVMKVNFVIPSEVESLP